MGVVEGVGSPSVTLPSREPVLGCCRCRERCFERRTDGSGKVIRNMTEAPSRLGAYLLIRRLGEGGQGVVFLGEDPAGRPVAVKCLHPESDAAARDRFVKEAAATLRVAGFGAVRVLDADVIADRPYIVTEYVYGPTLLDHVVAEGPQAGEALYRTALGTAMALAAIHHAGVVHRDFKPGNVLLSPYGPRVIDF